MMNSHFFVAIYETSSGFVSWYQVVSLRKQSTVAINRVQFLSERCIKVNGNYRYFPLELFNFLC